MSHNTTDITVLGRNYTVTCPPEQLEHLQDIASELHRRFEQLKQRTGSTSMEHLAVMVALNLLHEHDEAQIEQVQLQTQMEKRLKALEASIGDSLAKHITNPKKPVEPSQ